MNLAQHVALSQQKCELQQSPSELVQARNEHFPSTVLQLDGEAVGTTEKQDKAFVGGKVPS